MPEDEFCGLGCGEPVWLDGYCDECWHRESFKLGGPVGILPRVGYTNSTKAEDLPDHFPEDWK